MATLTVNVADCKLSKDPRDVLVTHALGSCVAVLLYDPVSKIAGLLHFMLPDSSVDVAKAAQNPFIFADSGIRLLVRRAVMLGAEKSRTVCMVVGGARMLGLSETFHIGERNLAAVAAILHQQGIHPRKHDTGGTCARTLCLDIARGHVRIGSSAQPDYDSITDLTGLAKQSRPARAGFR